MDSDGDTPRYKKRQRVGAESSSKTTKQPHANRRPVQSFLARFLLSWFAWGECSPQSCQVLASLAVKDIMQSGDEDSVPTELMWLANIGTRGEHPNSMHRDIMQRTENFSRFQKPFYVKMPFKEYDDPQNQAILLPHETFAALYHHYQGHWKKSVLPDTSELRAFWKLQKENPQYEDHPVWHRENFSSMAIPFLFHGDGVPVTGIGKVWCKLMHMFSISSCLGQGGTLDLQLFVWAVFDRLLVPGEEGTMAMFFLILKWSFYWLWLGLWPDRDWQGNLCLGIVEG